MSEVIIYGKDNCPHCVTAQKLCMSNNMTMVYKKLHKDFNDDKVSELVEQTRHRTFPFIFLDGEFIGGAKELHKTISKR